MHGHTPLRIAGVVLALALIGGCSTDNTFGEQAPPGATPPPVATPSPSPEPTPAPPAAPRNVEEALAIPDEEYDYAAAFANSGRGGF